MLRERWKKRDRKRESQMEEGDGRRKREQKEYENIDIYFSNYAVF